MFDRLEWGAPRGLADRGIRPSAVSCAHNGLDHVTGGEAEPGIALVGRRTTETHVGRRYGEPVVDLGHRSAVDGL